MPNTSTSVTSRRITVERSLLWVDRSAAWLSALLLVLYVVSGFGMTKPLLVESMTGGLITWRVAYDMHNLLHIPLIVGFTIHTFMGLRRAVLRVTRKRHLAAGLAMGFALVVLGFLLTLSLG